MLGSGNKKRAKDHTVLRTNARYRSASCLVSPRHAMRCVEAQHELEVRLLLHRNSVPCLVYFTPRYYHIPSKVSIVSFLPVLQPAAPLAAIPFRNSPRALGTQAAMSAKAKDESKRSKKERQNWHGPSQLLKEPVQSVRPIKSPLAAKEKKKITWERKPLCSLCTPPVYAL